MKNTSLVVAPSQKNPEIEKLILSTDKLLKEQAQQNAQHFAKRNLPSPEDTSLEHYTDDIKSGYESLQTLVLQKLQPDAHYPEASIDGDHLRDRDKFFDTEIKKREDLNKNDEYTLGINSPSSIKGRLNIAIGITLLLTIGETVFNAMSFSIFGENLLYSLILSAGISVAVLCMAHFASFLFKGSKSRLQRWIIALSTLTLVSGLFIVLAVLRSKYLAYHEVQVAPIYFFMFNLFFFIVAALMSLIILPSWNEIKENLHRIKIEKNIIKRKGEIEFFKNEKMKLKNSINENTKKRVRDSYYSEYQTIHINKLYREAIGQFKRCNLSYRDDKCVPVCFNAPIEDLTKPNYQFLVANTTDK